MANPNIVAVTEIYGKTALLAVTNSATAIITNSSASNKILKINSLLVSNIDSTTTVTLTVDIFRGGSATRIIQGVSISPGTSFTAIDKSVVIYLEEGDSLRLAAGTNNTLEAICSYEEII